MTALSLKNQADIELKNIHIDGMGDRITNLVSLEIINCGNLDVKAFLDKCLNSDSNLSRIELGGVNWDKVSVEYLQKLYAPQAEGGYGLKGLLSDAITISGVCTLHENVSGEDMAEIRAHIKGLKFVFFEFDYFMLFITFLFLFLIFCYLNTSKLKLLHRSS